MRGLSMLFAGWRGWLRSWFVRSDPPRLTEFLEELPKQLDPKKVYVLGEGDHRWIVAMVCPCGCGATLEMSVLADAKPRWRLIEHADRTATLQPSVWRRVGCRSHFFLRRGRVVWCS